MTKYSYTIFQVNISTPADTSPEKYILTMGNNSRKSKSGVTKITLDLCYGMTILYAKFQINISEDGREKSEKLKCNGQTDERTDWRIDRLMCRRWANLEPHSPGKRVGD